MVVLLLAGGGSGLGIYVVHHKKTDLAGYVGLYTQTTGDDDSAWSGTTRCHGAHGFDDIKEGLPISAEAADGIDLGTVSMGPGVVKVGNVCVFSFSFQNVKRSSQYKITLGSTASHGSISFPFSERGDMEITLNKQ